MTQDISLFQLKFQNCKNMKLRGTKVAFNYIDDKENLLFQFGFKGPNYLFICYVQRARIPQFRSAVDEGKGSVVCSKSCGRQVELMDNMMLQSYSCYRA